MTRVRGQASPSPKPEENTELAQWVQQMHDHFREFGYFRAADLHRVLGDPRQHVEIKTEDDPAANILLKA